MKISLLGCGWLGFPLAQKLIEKGYEVKGSTTSKNKLKLLETNKIEPFLIELSEKNIVGNVSNFLYNSEILIINIPPGLRKIKENTSEKTFVQKIKNLLFFIEKSEIKKIIFISSTSVYTDSERILKVTENSFLQPETESGKQLLEAENILRNNTNFDTIIIRFGGLIGKNRNAISMLAGKNNIPNPEAPINLIDQEDCITIIIKMLQLFQNSKVWNEIYNAVSPKYITRKNYYTQKAIEFNLPQPQFLENQPSVGKIVSCEKLEKVLGYKFKNLVNL